MAFNIPTTTELALQNLALLEGKINQDAPLVDKSFLRTLSVMEAFIGIMIQKYQAERSKQNLAKTATGIDLENIGSNIGVLIKLPKATVLEIQINAEDATIIPQGTVLSGNANGLLYFSDADAIASGGIAVLTATCELEGSDGNLNNGQILTLTNIILGAANTGVVTDTIQTGTDKEDQEVYRERILINQRAVRGGGNRFDHKIWAEEVEGVFKAYPYSGKPFGSIETSYPGDRTVYVQADTNIDPDGIAPQSLLDEVRSYLNTDPLTLRDRPPLGSTNEVLYVLSINRLPVYITIYDLRITLNNLTEVKLDVESALQQYLFNLQPFIEGIDLIQDRDDVLSTPSVSSIVDDVLKTQASAAHQVTFGFTPTTTLDYFQIIPAQLVKLDSVIYVD